MEKLTKRWAVEGMARNKGEHLVTARTSRGLLMCWDHAELSICMEGNAKGTKTMLRACYDEKEGAVEGSGEITYYKCADGMLRQINLQEEEVEVFLEAMSSIKFPGKEWQGIVFENAALSEMLEVLERDVYCGIWQEIHPDVKKTLHTVERGKRDREKVFDQIVECERALARSVKRQRSGEKGGEDTPLNFYDNEFYLETAEFGVDRFFCGEFNLSGYEVPTNVPSRRWTLGEKNWFSAHWNYDDCNGGLNLKTDQHFHSFFFEEVEGGGKKEWGSDGLGVTNKTPTLVPSRKWTRGEKEWFATHWSYNGSYAAEPDGSTRGGDETEFKECVVTHSSQRPRGMLRVGFLFLSVVTSIGKVESSKDGEVGANSFGNGEGYEEHISVGTSWGACNFGKIVFLLIFLGVFACRKRFICVGKGFLLGCFLAEPYERALEEFFANCEVKEMNRYMTQMVLWTRMVGDTLQLMEEDVDSLSTFKDEPQARVEHFFLMVDSEMDELCAEHSCGRKNVVGMYVKGIYELNQSNVQPTWQIDSSFWYFLLCMVAIMWRDALGAFETKTAGFLHSKLLFSFGVGALVNAAIVCICVAVAMKTFMNGIWGNCHRWSVKHRHTKSQLFRRIFGLSSVVGNTHPGLLLGWLD